MAPITRFTATIWTFLSVLDAGHQEDPELVWSKIQDGTVVDYLGKKYDVDTTLLRPEDWDAVLDFFREMSGVNTRKKFGVERNGLALIIALATEGVQQSQL
jgi:hypothetical protein